MSDKVGMVQYGSDDEYVFLGREMGRRKSIAKARRAKLTRKSSTSLMEATKPRGTSSSTIATSWN